MKEIGPMSYPGRSYGQGILVYFKISDSTLVAKNDYWTKDESVCLRFIFSRLSLLWDWSLVKPYDVAAFIEVYLILKESVKKDECATDIQSD